MSGTPAPDPRWEAWRLAEAALSAPGRLEEAVASLPPRQGWILRAMAALEGGERDEVDPLCGDLLAAGQRDLVCLLRLCVLSPEDIDPTEIRRRAKDAGVLNEPGLPTLDLVRLFASKVGDATPARPPSLAKAAHERPVLFALLPLLSPRFKIYDMAAELTPLSPRLNAYWAMGTAWETRHSDVREMARLLAPDVGSHFAKESWPDLGAKVDADPLSRWLATTPPPPWSRRLARHMAAVVTAEPRDTQQRALGMLLPRIEWILREGLPLQAIEPTGAALALAHRLDGKNPPSALTRQLATLADRLDWWKPDPDRSVVLLASLWTALRKGTPEERAAFAEEVMENTGGGIYLPQPLRGELMLEMAFAAKNGEDERPLLVMAMAKDVPRPTLERALAAKNDRPRAELYMGMHELGRGESAAPLLRATRMFGLPGGVDGAVRLGWFVLRLGIDPRERPSRRLRRALESFLSALADHTPTIELAAHVPLVLHYAFGAKEANRRTGTLLPCLERAIDAPRKAGDPGVAHELVLCALLGREEQGRTRLREVGRHLRRHRDDPAAWTHALSLVSVLAGTPPPRLPLVQATVDAVSAFLLHRGSDHLLPLFRAHRSRDELDSMGLAAWIAEHRADLGDHPAWDEMASADPDDESFGEPEWMDDMPDDFASALEALLGEEFDG